MQICIAEISSNNLTNFIKFKPWRPGMDTGRITITEIYNEIRTEAGAFKEKCVKLLLIKTRHGTCVQSQGARGYE